MVLSGCRKKLVSFSNHVYIGYTTRVAEMPKVEEVNAIKMELETFAHAIETGQAPPVTVDDGAHALEVAYDILNQLNHTANLMH